jgi:hypothetical protein
LARLSGIAAGLKSMSHHPVRLRCFFLGPQCGQIKATANEEAGLQPIVDANVNVN